MIESHITRNPEVPGGKPIVRGTRVAVSLIVALSENGLTPEEIVADYPDLTIEDVEVALALSKEKST